MAILETNDTITALATPPGLGGVAIIRISGPLVKKISTLLIKKPIKPRYATLADFKDENDETIDTGIVLYFPAPHSFTGEDVLELQGHGGSAVTHRLIQHIIRLGARLAQPGEFSQRAFLNEKIDLVQAEAIADLISASSEQARKASMRSLQGEFSKKIHAIVEALIHLRMFVEAAIDFVEEEIDFLADKRIEENLITIQHSISELRLAAYEGSLLQDGITVVIAGKPNVGKSSLLNCLSAKEIAIVTDIPGTTRDILREQILLDGIPIHVVDTAGLRLTDDPVEKEGIRRAREEITRADLILYLISAQDPFPTQTELVDFPTHIPLILIRNKIDLTCEKKSITFEDNKAIVALSVKENNGLDLLKNKIKKIVGFGESSGGALSARRRHLEALDKASQFLLNGKIQLSKFRAGELLAEDLRQAQLALSEITGEFTSDDLLGKIFSSFCVGK